MTFYNIAAVEHQSSPNNQSTIQTLVWYRSFIDEAQKSSNKIPFLDTLFVNSLVVEDRKGNRHVINTL